MLPPPPKRPTKPMRTYSVCSGKNEIVKINASSLKIDHGTAIFSDQFDRIIFAIAPGEWKTAMEVV